MFVIDVISGGFLVTSSCTQAISNMSSPDEESSSDISTEELDAEEGSIGSSDLQSEKEESTTPSKIHMADKDFQQMSFEDLLQLKRRLGSKVYNEAVFGKTQTDNKTTDLEKIKQQNKKKCIIKNESDSDGPPEELTAKRKVPALGVAKNSRKVAQSRFRDPRFDAKQGYFSGTKFRAQYGFINDMRSQELTTLKKQLAQSNDPERIEQLKFTIRRTENQILEFNKQKEQDKKRKEEKLQARRAIDDGKQPYYEKNSTRKARELVEKYNKLKEGGKIDKHIDKRKRKITSKDRKKLDFST
ncbi:ribosomal RNA processing protein 36 homolog isoform X2 [Armigeres subalbatus]|uniref:ribosomal RNA processing protein 36 homolog isoform X2 n=1 Tax=Armigeres subalbatus TaxID=124917 RepID=UPI002ED4AC4B